MLDDTEVARASGSSSASAQSAQSAVPTTDTATVPSDDQGRRRSEILRHIITHSAPAQLPAPWSFLASKPRFRTLNCHPPELVDSLQNNFSVADLRAARVYVPGPNDEPELAPALGSRLLRLLVDADGAVIDLVGDSGSLFGADPPCFHYACQWAVGAGPTKRVFVAELQDLQIFECLGLRCTPAAGLATLSGEQVRRLYANLSPTSRPLYRLTLVGASIADLENELPSHIAPILDRLQEAQELFEYGKGNDMFELWRPCTQDFDRICAAVRFSDREIIRRKIHASVESSVRSSSDAWRQLHAPDQTNLLWAHAALIREISNPNPIGSRETLKAAAIRLSSAMNGLTTRRFMQAANAAATPQESFAMLMKAQVVRHLNESYGLLEAAKPRRGFSHYYDPTLSDEQLEGIERGIDLIRKIDRLSPQV